MTTPLNKIKPWSLRPHDEALGFSTNQFLDWVQIALNALIGQSIQVGQGLDALSKSSVDPTTARLISLGSRPQSITTALTFTSTPTSFSFWWDGTNGSTRFTIYRDDGTIIYPPLSGSGLTVSGLVASTKYFFYPYFDEGSQLVVFPSVTGAVGSPPIAYTSQSALAAQAQIMRNRIPLAPNFGTTGITTPASGSGSGNGGSGGGGGGKGQLIL